MWIIPMTLDNHTCCRTSCSGDVTACFNDLDLSKSIDSFGEPADQMQHCLHEVKEHQFVGCNIFCSEDHSVYRSAKKNPCYMYFK